MPGVPYTFATSTAPIPLSQLDSNFNTTLTIGSTSVGLGNTVTSLAGLVNLTMTGNLSYGGVSVNSAVTGTGNMVLSASPSITGTLSAATLTTSANTGIGAAAAANNRLYVYQPSAGASANPTLYVENATQTAANAIGLRIRYSGSDGNWTSGTGGKFLSFGDGTAAYAEKFYVDGAGSISGANATFNGTGNFTNANGGNYINLTNTTNSSIFQFENNTGSCNFYSNANVPMNWYTNSTLKMTLSAAGLLGIGMTPSNILDITQSQNAASIGRIFNGTSGTAGSAEWRASNDVNDSIRLISINQSYTTSGLFAARKSVIASDGVGLAITTMSAQAMQFGINNSEVARFDSSGNLLVGCTAQPSGSVKGAELGSNVNKGYLFLATNTTSSDTIGYFYNPNGLVGSITTSASATAYNTSSDARLKNNITDAGDAGVIIDALKVRQWDWKVDGSHQDFGFVAQEEAQVYAPAVTVGDDGEEIERQWQRDDSKLVPLLVKEIQSLRRRLAAAGIA